MFCSLNTFEQQEQKKDVLSSAESSTVASPVVLSMECNGHGVCGADLLSDLQYIDSEGQTTDSSSSSSSGLSGRRIPTRQLTSSATTLSLTNCDSSTADINDMALLPEVTVISKPQTQTDNKSRTSSLSELNLSPQFKSVTQSRHLKNNSPETTKKLRSSRLKKRLSATKKYLRLGHSFSNASCSSSNSSANNSRSSSTNREFFNSQSVVKNNNGLAIAPYASVESETIDDSPTSKTRVNSISSIVDVTYSDGGVSAGTPSNSSSTSSIHRLQNGVESSVESASPDDIRQSSTARNEASTSTSTAVQSAASSTTVQQCVTAGPRFKLLREGDIHVCYLNHTRTIISKILSSKFLRRWECHHLYLNDSCISSKTQTGFLEQSISYSHMEEVYVVARWDAGHKFCIRIVIPDGSLLLQAGNAYTRDQWYHSIVWKKNLFKYGHILKKSTRKDVILKELKNLVEYTTTTPLQDECVTNVPLEIISKLLVEDQESWMCRELSEILLSTIVPLLDNCPPSSEMCRFFSRHCNMHPRSPKVADCLTPIVHRILKHNVDFGKSPFMRRFVQDYLYALYSHNAGDAVLNKFVRSMHGPGSGCPHPRVLPNLVSVCLAAVFTYYENLRLQGNKNETPVEENKTIVSDSQLQCFVTVFLHISEYEDWRPGLAQLLQPIPFPDECLSHEPFITSFAPVIEKIGMDKRCEVHQMVLGVREGKEGWFHVYCPSSIICTDSGKLWCLMLQNLFQCCCKRKRFLIQLTKQLGACLLLALRHQVATQEALCLMLEWGLIESQDQRLQVVTTLQSTACGRAAYSNLCQRQQDLKELQQKGGPRKLTLPSRSTDDDLARLLSCGSFGNLECLSLAFTHVTSACAEHLIKLPALRYLNLWATQFGDAGVQMISEHLPKLQILNLCETPVSDEGIATLSAMTNLRKLNLNSTKLSAQTFENLKKKLPKLQEFDVRYTEAW